MTEPANETFTDEELVPEDDAVIGRAFRWSLGVFAIIGVGTGLVIWAATRPEPVAPPLPVPEIDPITPTRAAAPPTVVFTDITGEAGIDFVHVNGAVGDKLLPETMGGGAAFLDFDGDGDQDLLLVNSTRWPDSPAEGALPTQALYRNDGTGRFTDVTAASGLDVSFFGMGAAVGDYDGDGDADVYLTAVGPNHLFENDGGVFRDVTARAGVAGDTSGWGTSAAFWDYDGDGDLDLLVANYVQWSREIDFEVDYRLTGIGRAYGPPTNFEGSFADLYRNDGGGTFTDVSAEAGIEITNQVTGVPVAKALGLAMVDVDGDGLTDVFVANDTVRNFLFRNLGDGSFEEIGSESGIAYSGMGAATGAMGIDVAHYRNGPELGFAIGNFANEMSSLYVAQTAGWQFTDEAITEGVGAPSRKVLTFGLFFFDYDLDGRLDLLAANGHLEEEINAVQSSQHYRQPAQLFWNAGPEARTSFVEVDTQSTGDLTRAIVGRGAAYADIDGDGDLDVLLTQVGGPPLLLRNDQALGHHWLRVTLAGVTSPIGAWIELVTPDGEIQRRRVMPTRSYLSQVELPVTFGLGDNDRVESLRVVWPNCDVQEVEVETIDATLRIEQPAG